MLGPPYHTYQLLYPIGLSGNVYKLRYLVLLTHCRSTNRGLIQL